MPDVFAAAEALYRNALDIWWVLPLSIVVMVGSTVLLPWLIIQMPPDYFLQGHRHPLARRERHWALHVALVLGKNALGFVMVLAGVAMLALPGQGVLTILAGLMVMDFPGKYRLEGAIIRRPAVLKGLNWIRRRAIPGAMNTSSRFNPSGSCARRPAGTPPPLPAASPDAAPPPRIPPRRT